MYRNLVGALLAVFSLLAVPNLGAQYGTPSAGPPPDAQVQQYPQAQPYPDTQAQYPPAQYPQAQQYPQDQTAQTSGQMSNDDRQHGIARLSIAQGDVNVKRGDTGELVAAVVNAPLLAQDHVQTSSGSRAEIQFDYANIIRIAPDTDLGLPELEYQQYQVQLAAGTIIWRVLRDSNAQAEVDTPSVAIKSQQQGDYRISVLQDGSTEISVRSGQLEVYSPRGTQQLQAGSTMLVRGDSSDPEFQVVGAIARDQFDDWSANRDRQLLASQSYQHVSRDVYGADDLDQYGNWVPSQYGQVWEPTSPGSDWAPYSNGQWVWEPYYGWTWVDAAPWGWAPFHYGRWFWNTGYGWCWWPGSIFSPAFWSPALVGFFGWGGGFGFGWGGLGWVALAPFELFHPWWGHGFHDGFFGRGYGYDGFRNANVANMYRNAAIRNAAITTGYNQFGRGRTNFGRATAVQLRSASALRGQLPVTPVRASRQFTSRPASANPRLSSAANRQFFQSQRAPQSARGFVGQQQTQGRRVGGQLNSAQRFDTAQRTTTASQNVHGVPPNMRAQMAARGAAGTAANGGWQRFGEPGRTSGFRAAPSASEQSGWHSFGQPHRSASSGYGAARPAVTTSSPSYGRPSSGAGYGGSYASRPLGSNPAASRAPQSSFGYRPSYNAAPTGARSFAAPSMPRYNAPAASHYSAPSTPHYSAPSAPHFSAPRGGGPSLRGGERSHGGGGGGGSHGGGGGHSSGGAHRR